MKTLLKAYIATGIVILGILIISQIAYGAPTSTRVQDLFITNLSGNGTVCLQITNAGLVVTSSAACGTGGGGSTTTINQLFNSSNTFNFVGAGGLTIATSSTSTVTFTQGAGGGSGSFNATGTSPQLLIFTGTNTGTSSVNLSFNTSTLVLEVIGTVSSTDIRSPSSTITAMTFTNASGTQITASIQGTRGDLTSVSSTGHTNSGAFQNTAGRADFGLTSTTGLFATTFQNSGLSTLQGITFTNATGTNLQVTTGIFTTLASSTGLTFLNATSTGNLLITTVSSTGLTFLNATSTGNLLITTVSSTGITFTNATTTGNILAGSVSSTGITFTNATSTGNLLITTVSSTGINFLNASGTNQTLIGYLTVTGALSDSQSNKYSTSSGSGTPGGSDTQIQYNGAGSFAGSSVLTFTSSTGVFAAPTGTFAGAVAVGTTTLNGLFSVVNSASGTTPFLVATSTDFILAVTTSSATSTITNQNLYFGVASTSIIYLSGTSTAAFGGGSLALDACASTVTSVPVVLSSSTDILLPPQPQVPINRAVFAIFSDITSVDSASTSITTSVCDILAAGATPTSTKYNIGWIRTIGK